jgi:phenylacetate-CoA ligase
MASFALQLAQVAERKGIDVATLTIRKILTAAEPISKAKRDKIERLWNAELYDQFGCTEGSAMGSESARHDGLHMWTDLFHIEVVDEGTGKPVGEGQPGILVFTPLWNNTITPFLRWASGDIVTYHETTAADGPLAVFPIIRHAARTSGFFKVRGVNINHAEFEDLMHRMPEVADFLCEAVWTGTLDTLKLSVELRRGADEKTARETIAAGVRKTFEITPEVAVIEHGAVERALASQLKPQRIVDRRSA